MSFAANPTNLSTTESAGPKEFPLAGYSSGRLQWAGFAYMGLFMGWMALNTTAILLVIIVVATIAYLVGLTFWYLLYSPRWSAKLTPEHLGLNVEFRYQRYPWDRVAAVDIERLHPRRLLGIPVEGGEAGTVRITLKRRGRFPLGGTLRIRPKDPQAFTDAVRAYIDRYGSRQETA